VTIVRLLMHYLGTPRAGFWKAIKQFYALVVGVHLMTTCAYFGIISCWFVLAAVLDPSRFLPYGMAVVVVVVVALTVSSELLAAADKLKAKLFAAFQKGLQLKLKLAMDKLEQELWEKLQSDATALASNQEDADHDAEQAALFQPLAKPEVVDKEKEITPADIFMALDTDGSGQLTMDQFKRLFDLLELDITDGQKEQLFAFCDSDMTGEISEKEFADGWELMVQVFLENSADSLGLSRTQIFLVVSMLLTTLVLTVVFILLTLTAWQNEGSFEAVVQSVMISGVGKASAALRTRSKAESEENIDGLVGKIMNDQEEKVAENGA